MGIRVSLESMPPSRWPSIALLGFLLLGLGNGGVVVAELWVPSGLTAVLVATSPFWMAFVEGFLKDGERLRARARLGLTVGFSGILLLVWPDLTLQGSVSAACWPGSWPSRLPATSAPDTC